MNWNRVDEAWPLASLVFRRLSSTGNRLVGSEADSPVCYRQKQTTSRRGLTLLEVLLAIAILGGSMVVIGQLFSLGIRSARQTRLRSDANLLCDTKMAELVAGVLPAQSVGEQMIAENLNWSYSVAVQPSRQPGLLMATVSVKQSDASISNPVELSVVRFLPDPDYEPEEE